MNQPDAGKGGLNDNAIERFAHGFERIALLILVVAIAIITVIALLRLGNGVYGTVTSPWDLQNTASMQYLFGMVLTVLIALELGNSILRHFKERYDIVGDVRGAGLFLGIELVRNRHTLEPAAAEASFISNQMREQHILMGTDGPYHNVVKIRPPMPFNHHDADLLVDTMDKILAENF